jgi:hypothetical protein
MSHSQSAFEAVLRGMQFLDNANISRDYQKRHSNLRLTTSFEDMYSSTGPSVTVLSSHPSSGLDETRFIHLEAFFPLL